MKNVKDYTELVFILDRSGSMGGLERDTIGGFNSVLRKNKEQEGDAIVSTVLFDDRIEVICDREQIGKVAPITEEEYYVRGCTALLDAVGGAIRHVSKDATQASSRKERRLRHHHRWLRERKSRVHVPAGEKAHREEAQEGLGIRLHGREHRCRRRGCAHRDLRGPRSHVSRRWNRHAGRIRVDGRRDLPGAIGCGHHGFVEARHRRGHGKQGIAAK